MKTEKHHQHNCLYCCLRFQMIRNVLLGIKLLSAAICPLQRSMHQRCTFSLPVGSGQDSEHPSAPSSVHTQQILLALSRIRLRSQRCTRLGSPKPPRSSLRSLPGSSQSCAPLLSACPSHTAGWIRGVFCGTLGRRRVSGGLRSVSATTSGHRSGAWR